MLETHSSEETLLDDLQASFQKLEHDPVVNFYAQQSIANGGKPLPPVMPSQLAMLSKAQPVVPAASGAAPVALNEVSSTQKAAVDVSGWAVSARPPVS